VSTDEVPNVPRRHVPDDTRPSSATAWAAAWRFLDRDEPVPRAEVIAVMRKASPISWRTAREVLTDAVSSGLLEVASRDRYNRPILKRPR
jgi:hypothetical protein